MQPGMLMSQKSARPSGRATGWLIHPNRCALTLALVHNLSPDAHVMV